MTETEHKPDHRENIDRQHQTRYIVYDKSQTNYCQHNEANKPYQYHLKSPLHIHLNRFSLYFHDLLKKRCESTKIHTKRGITYSAHFSSHALPSTAQAQTPSIIDIPVW